MTLTRTMFLVVVVTTAVHFVLREAGFERATVRRLKISFPPVYGLRAMFWLGVPGFLYAAYRVRLEMRSSFDWILPIIGVGFALMAFFSYPGTISLDEDGISIRRFHGFRARRLRWRDVASAVHSDSQKEIVLYGRDGEAITHTRLHVDQLRFENEVTRYLKTAPIHR